MYIRINLRINLRLERVPNYLTTKQKEKLKTGKYCKHLDKRFPSGVNKSLIKVTAYVNG